MLTPEGYKPRIIDDQIRSLMKIYGAVCVEGPKWCGKTWTSSNHVTSISFIGDPAGNFMNKQLVELDPSLVIEGEYLRLNGRGQVVPAISAAVWFEVVQVGQKGIYILLG